MDFVERIDYCRQVAQNMHFLYDHSKKKQSGLTMAMKTKRSKPSRYGNTRYKVENWSEYNEALRRRGDVTVWISETLLEDWHHFGLFRILCW